MVGKRLVIKEKKSSLFYLGWISAVILLIAVSFYIGRYLSNKEREDMLDKISWLNTQVENYQQAYQQTNQELVMQTQSAKVDNQSQQQLVETVKGLQEKQQELEAELKFYRNIMAPELAQQGLTIDNFEAINFNANALDYKLVLTQAGRQEQFIKGDIELEVVGQLNGETQTLPFRELGTFQNKDFQFQFRYFQNIEGQIQLPANFVAERINVRVKTTGLRKNQNAEKQFSWELLMRR